ncbi:MAG: hypothetical protein K0U98_13475 [Deltaproteobacteria bacterium]|nr:hypothetical protein [Deltaproteobacteria bacterium]
MLLWTMAASVVAEPPQKDSPFLVAPAFDIETLDVSSLKVDVTSPAEFLGYSLGSRFTQHHRVLSYLESLASHSPRLTLWKYGETYEGRPLVQLAISSEANLARLEELRQNHLRLATDPELPRERAQQLLDRAPAIVWLAYGVHGNESSSTEVSMAVAYALAASSGKWADLLDDVIVLIDPLVNPDGRERYVGSFLQRQGKTANPLSDALEHQEPWPGGRTNHYMIDLNRDWTWATQVETRARIAAYRRWEPHAFADFHEMSSDSTYFFPPAAEPILPLIDSETLHWLEIFGKANARAFDAQGWLYYNKEKFDLFYPGYGDTYPALRAAVGMTYEVAGGARGGLSVTTARGEALTLSDRIVRHFTTSLTTIEVAARHREDLVESFLSTRRRPMQEPVRSFLVEPNQAERPALIDLLRLHGIDIDFLSTPTTLDARSIALGKGEKRTFPTGTLVISTAQPLGHLVRALMEREAQLSTSFLERQQKLKASRKETEFYDVTAWSLPLAFAMPTWVIEGEPAPSQAPKTPETPETEKIGLHGDGAVGILVPPQGLSGYRLASKLQKQGIHYRLILSELTSGGRSFPAGTLFIPARSNLPEAQPWIEEALEEEQLEGHRVSSTTTTEGVSLGSDEVVAIRPPMIALASGAGLSPSSHGTLWHLLDRLVEAPYSRIDIGSIEDEDLRLFDVLILPDSNSYQSILGPKAARELTRWLEAGGFLVAIGGAIDWLHNKELSRVEHWQPIEEELEKKGVRAKKRPFDKISTPGAALSSQLNIGHPLAAGSPSSPAVLALGDRVLQAFGDPRRDLLLARQESPVLAGFAWPEARQRLAGSLLVGVEKKKAGRVMFFTYDPTFRLFWRGTMPLLLNGLLHGPSLQEAGFLE